MRSAIVVISWWSNALGLTCLDRLLAHTCQREIYVVQVGKSAASKARFRQHLPPAVIELDYPADAPGEHSRVIQDIARRQLRHLPGLWFVDHDVFLLADAESWLQTADAHLAASEMCLCLHPSPKSPALTQPAFWLAPARWPDHIPDVDPLPFTARPEARRPDLYQHDGQLRMPEKDTLVRAWETLSASGQATRFHLAGEPASALPPFPPHTHLGGLYLLTGPPLPAPFRDWMQTTVAGFSRFFAASPWREAEDPVLLARLETYQQWLTQGVPDA